MSRLILLRHGQSTWNAQNRFTGWEDVPLSAEGRQQVKRASRALLEAQIEPHLAFVSVLKRAVESLDLLLATLKLALPIFEDWRLNERHYGALQGLNKKELAKKHGERQVLLWRRSVHLRPPPLKQEKALELVGQLQGLPAELVPLGESLQDAAVRVLACFQARILPCLLTGKTVLVVAHGNSLRALYRHFAKLDEPAMLTLNIPTAVPWVLDLNDQGHMLETRKLGQP